MISSRDDPAFEAFVRTSSDHLLRTAYLLSGDRGYAEDLVQTALLRTARRWRAARRQPHAYARRIVINLAKDRWRELSRRPPESPLGPVDDAADVQHEPDGLIDRHDLIQALGALAAGQRAVIVLRFFDDLSVAETAASLGCSQGTVKSQTSRALAALREALHDPNHTQDHTKETSHAHR